MKHQCAVSFTSPLGGQHLRLCTLPIYWINILCIRCVVIANYFSKR